MAVHLTLRTDDTNRVTAFCDGEILAGPTPLAQLPTLKVVQADPYVQGRLLARALGGKALLERLRADPLLLLETDDRAAAVPWEFAAFPRKSQFLGCEYGFLRLIPRDAPPPPPPGTLHFVVLGADPLVDAEGHARDGYRLKIDDELQAVRRVLRRSAIDLQAERIPPTREALRRALQRGPAVLHLSCHGDVIPTHDGPTALLHLEDASGGPAPLLGPDLAALPPRGVLRLVLLSACHTAEAGTTVIERLQETQLEPQADLARALVARGVPAAIGMQGAFPDALSDDLAAALYDALLAGHDLAEALRQTRLALNHTPDAAGLPVAYVARQSWGALPLRAGRPNAGALRLPGRLNLSQDIQPPRPLRGRNAELHGLARLYDQGARVVTVVGSGGIGKTALAATFAERFGWRRPDGVLGVSFAAAEVDAQTFRAALLEQLLPGGAAHLEQAPAAEQNRAFLDALRDWDGLLLIDNYESVLQLLESPGEAPASAAKRAAQAEAEAIHRLLAQAANGGAQLLLTSRHQPAGLAGEVVFPKRRALPGLDPLPAAALFLHHSTRAKDEAQGVSLALQVARAAEGHPLAIALLAGEYDRSPVNSTDFLAHWDDELEQAQRIGLAEHHVTFTAALDRSYAALAPAQQTRLRALSVFGFPFFAEGAALVWSDEREEKAQRDAVADARDRLGDFTRRSLLEVEGWFEDATPATWRFQPALRQALTHKVSTDERPALARSYAAYGAWLARRGLDIHKDTGLARVVRLSLDALDAATNTLAGLERLQHARRTAWIKRSYGRTQEAFALLETALADPALASPAADPPTHPAPEALEAPERSRAAVASSLKHELAGLCITRGDLDRALALYQESLQLYEQLGDLQGKAATLSGMANVQMAKGEWAEAQQALREASKLAQKLGHLEGTAFAVVQLGQIAQAQGDAETALARYREGLALFQHLGMPRETAQVQQLIAQAQGVPPSSGETTSDPVRAALAQAQTAAQRRDFAAACAAQQTAIDRLRKGVMQEGAPREGLVSLSVLLYNLAGYLQQAGRFTEAVTALEEVVALDERTGHADLPADREQLAQARRLAALPPEERPAGEAAREAPDTDAVDLEALIHLPAAQVLASARAQLAQLPPEQRAQAEVQLRAFAAQWEQLPPEARRRFLLEQQAAGQAAAQRERISGLAAEARDAAIAVLRGEFPCDVYEAHTARLAAQAADGEEAGSPWEELARYLHALLALVRGEPLPPAPDAYVAHIAAVKAAQMEQHS